MSHLQNRPGPTRRRYDRRPARSQYWSTRSSGLHHPDQLRRLTRRVAAPLCRWSQLPRICSRHRRQTAVRIPAMLCRRNPISLHGEGPPEPTGLLLRRGPVREPVFYLVLTLTLSSLSPKNGPCFTLTHCMSSITRTA